MALVDKTHVSISQYNQAMAEERASLKSEGQAFPKAGSTSFEALQTSIIDALVQQAEFAIEATKLGITITPAEINAQLTALKKKYFGGSQTAYLAGLKKEGYTNAEIVTSIQQRLIEDKIFTKVTKSVTVSASDIQTYYDENITTYTKAATRKVREILVGKNKEALAEQILAQLKGGASFTVLAKKYSQDPGSKNSGGRFTAEDGSDVPAFDKAVFSPSAKTNELLPPVSTPQYGWFVIQPLAAIVPPTVTSEAKAAPAIRKQLLSTQQQQAVSTWVNGISKQFCTGGQISYQVGYTPSPDPCASITATNQTTT